MRFAKYTKRNVRRIKTTNGSEISATVIQSVLVCLCSILKDENGCLRPEVKCSESLKDNIMVTVAVQQEPLACKCQPK
jgi:hypothetical protein